MNILELIVIVVAALFAFSGFRKGFVKKLAAMVSLVLSVVLVSAFLPYITQFLKDSTPVYTFIVGECREVVEEQAAKGLLAGTQAGDRTGLGALGDGSLDAEGLGALGNVGLGAEGLGSLTRIEQTEVIEALPLPERLKDLLLDYNNEEGYRGLRVSNFLDYLVNFLATGILNVVAFLVSVIMVQLVLWVVLTLLNILAHFPVISIVNRFAGLLLGLLQALFLIWVFFLILSMISATDTGLRLMAMVESSALLHWLYESNLFLQLVLGAAAFFV